MLAWLLSCLLGSIAALATGYLLLLTLLSSRRRRPMRGSGATRFAFVVPAHDEEAGVAATVQSLLQVDYPAERRAVVVVADNCADDTAGKARLAGARIIERRDPDHRGKGYALELAFAQLLAEGECDAIVVVDADSTVCAGILAAFDAHIAAGARAMQARYGVRNRDASWRTRLMAIALGMFHDVRSLGRERLRVSCGLRGNGMCFTVDVLRDHPHRAHGLVEDVEYGIQLGLAGIRVHYVHAAEVLGEMASTGRTAASQRQRWEGGRAALRKQHLWPLLRRAPHSGIALDLALDLLTPPLSQIAALLAVGFTLEGVLWWYGTGPTAAAWLWACSALALALHAGRGVTLSGLGLRGFATLAMAPVYMAWKMVGVTRSPDPAWVRTEREKQRA